MTALPKGQYVKHYRYGFGVVTESDAELTSIEFELRGIKRFVTRLMVVELSDFTPPKPFQAKWVKTAPVASLRRNGGKAAKPAGTARRFTKR